MSKMLRESMIVIAVVLGIVLILGGLIAYVYEDTRTERDRSLIDNG